LEQQIAIVNISDEIVGYEEKQLVHTKGLLHRAFSVFIINSKRELLLQRRAEEKYHSAGLWTNTCCSHLPKGFEMKSYAHQRLMEEMGFGCELKYVETFHYSVDFHDGMIENEIDHIYFGVFDGDPNPDPTEVYDWRWNDINIVKDDVRLHPELYTYWFKYIIKNHLEPIEKLIQGC
jgi:isopentenyl-diphosphate Delta-isomerase